MISNQHPHPQLDAADLDGLEQMLKAVFQDVITPDERLPLDSPLLVRDLEWAVADAAKICEILSERSLSGPQLRSLASLRGAVAVAQGELLTFVAQL